MVEIKLHTNVVISKANPDYSLINKWVRCIHCDRELSNETCIIIRQCKGSKRKSYLHISCMKEFMSEVSKTFNKKKKRIMLEVL